MVRANVCKIMTFLLADLYEMEEAWVLIVVAIVGQRQCGQVEYHPKP